MKYYHLTEIDSLYSGCYAQDSQELLEDLLLSPFNKFSKFLKSDNVQLDIGVFDMAVEDCPGHERKLTLSLLVLHQFLLKVSKERFFTEFMSELDSYVACDALNSLESKLEGHTYYTQYLHSGERDGVRILNEYGELIYANHTAPIKSNCEFIDLRGVAVATADIVTGGVRYVVDNYIDSSTLDYLHHGEGTLVLLDCKPDEAVRILVDCRDIQKADKVFLNEDEWASSRTEYLVTPRSLLALLFYRPDSVAEVSYVGYANYFIEDKNLEDWMKNSESRFLPKPSGNNLSVKKADINGYELEQEIMTKTGKSAQEWLCILHTLDCESKEYKKLEGVTEWLMSQIDSDLF